MYNIAATPCVECIHSNGGKWCKLKLKTILNEKKDKIIGPGFCREFSTTQMARTPYGITAMIYFDKGDPLSSLVKTLVYLNHQNKQAPARAQDEPLDQIKQYVVMDNTLELNTDLFPLLQALGLLEVRLEQEFEPISFEKAVHYTINRYAKFDFTLALKAGSMFAGLWQMCDFDENDRYVFMRVEESQGLYLNQAFQQLGGGESFLQRLSNFDNCDEDLIVNYQDFTNKNS
jgi:hypothetical protein